MKVFKVPCTGRVAPGLIIKAFQLEAKNVLVSGCYPDACHYNSGNFMVSVFKEMGGFELAPSQKTGVLVKTEENKEGQNGTNR